MTKHIDYENIFTPQGILGHVSKQPNLDFLMNIFNIPRVYSVSESLDHFQAGLMAAVLERDEHGILIRKAGVMAIVLAGGEVRPGDVITVELPPEPHQSLEPV